MQAKRKRIERLGLKQYQELPWIVLYKEDAHYYNGKDEEISAAEYLKLMETCNTVVVEYVPMSQLPEYNTDGLVDGSVDDE